MALSAPFYPRTFSPNLRRAVEMLRIGCLILTIWTVLNLIFSFKIFTETLYWGGHTPALFLILTEAEVNAFSPETLATLDSIAVFANGLNVAFCSLALCVIWLGLFRRQIWGFFGLLIGFTAALIAGAAADYAVGTVAPWVNLVSVAILSIGLAFSALGLFRNRPLHDNG